MNAFKSVALKTNPNFRVVNFYGVGFACDLNRHLRYDNVYLLNKLAIFSSEELAKLACKDTVLSYQAYGLKLETFNKVFKLNVE